MYNKNETIPLPDNNEERPAENNNGYLCSSSHSWDNNRNNNNRSTNRGLSSELNYFLCIFSMVECLVWWFRVSTTNHVKNSGSYILRKQLAILSDFYVYEKVLPILNTTVSQATFFNVEDNQLIILLRTVSNALLMRWTPPFWTEQVCF
jgi:hypothetical protein